MPSADLHESFIENIPTEPYPDQKPGTSGLRKKVTVFQQPNYTENFVQSLLEAASMPKVLILGGDGRYYSPEVIQKIINICAANKVEEIIVGRRGILSTPAASAMIRSLRADGGIILTASHNPGGRDGDFGIKYNTSNGGPAPEQLTNSIYEISKSLKSYKRLKKDIELDLDALVTTTLEIGCKVSVVDPVHEYATLLEQQVFNFSDLKKLLSSPDGFKGRQFKMLADPMNGVLGPYLGKILIGMCKAPTESLINSKPMPDFGGKHPDPNLTYASDLVEKLKSDESIDLGVAFDGDGDRNMILGQGAFFVTPGDSLAVIAAHIEKIRWFSSIDTFFDEMQPRGVARSFPTAPAVDRVVERRKAEGHDDGPAERHMVFLPDEDKPMSTGDFYETPTGWKFFGNLMDKRLVGLCGEESFGIGSSHIREKDGLWACLAWLTIIAQTGKSVRELVEEHWQSYGRDYFCRYDFENCESAGCEKMMEELEAMLCNSEKLTGKVYGSKNKYTVKETGNFEYKDPVDKSVTSKQGLFVRFTNGARIIWRLSGTGSSGATVRVYLSDYSRDRLLEDSREYLSELVQIAYEISRLPEHTGRSEPTVIT